MDEQLAMWEEDDDKKIVVDHFNESCMDEIELEDDNTSFVSYRPTSFGEEGELLMTHDEIVRG